MKTRFLDIMCFCNLFYADVRFFSLFSEKYSFTALLKSMIFSKKGEERQNNVQNSMPNLIRHGHLDPWTLVVVVTIVFFFVNLPGTSAMSHLLLYPNWFRCDWERQIGRPDEWCFCYILLGADPYGIPLRSITTYMNHDLFTIFL